MRNFSYVYCSYNHFFSRAHETIFTNQKEDEDSFSAKKKAGVRFVDLTAACDSLAPRPHLQASAIAA